MILVIDNYDSFVHNLARYCVLAGCEVAVHRNDALSAADVKAMKPKAIVLSPGPCTPEEAGISQDIVRLFGPSIPILGVCLGHQCIGAVYGAAVVQADRPVHGKAEQIDHDGTAIFKDLPSPFNAGRYHALIIRSVQDTPLRVSARSAAGEIMAFHHTAHPVYGVQFHPESILTEYGQTMITNFKDIVEYWHTQKKTQ